MRLTASLPAAFPHTRPQVHPPKAPCRTRGGATTGHSLRRPDLAPTIFRTSQAKRETRKESHLFPELSWNRLDRDERDRRFDTTFSRCRPFRPACDTVRAWVHEWPT